ncbi:TLC domain-containing protein [Crassisporium funariophilum]|nr:TLC domain-containing protein [Crassisporium funariophilum]
MDSLYTLSPYLAPFYSLQYPTNTPSDSDSFHDSSYYMVGKLDICIVISCIATMAILRDAFRLLIFEPFARWKLLRDLRKRKRTQDIPKAKSKGLANGNGHVANGNGHTNGHSNGHSNGHGSNGSAVVRPTPKEMRQLNRSVLRFAEQGWSVVYYSLQWSFGLYVHYHLPTRIFDPSDLWRHYPHIPLAAPVKFYYLTQTAFYMHQMLILNAEARRKDHVQMMAHHIITVILMVTSYFTNFTRVGCCIMVLMDWCDIFLPLAKMIRYIEISQFLCDMTFGWFMLSWLVTRHFLFLFVIHSTMFTGPRLIDMQWTPEKGYYFDAAAHMGFCILLLSLQVMQCIWFWMICRVAWRVLTTEKGAADVRSDSEDEDSDKKAD